MANVSEIAADLFRLSIYVPDLDLQFNHFLVRDEQPLLFHAGLKGMNLELREAIETLIDLQDLRYVAWSHFESDEIGGLNQWLERAPKAEPVCSFVGKVVSVDDYALRPARGMSPDDLLSTGRYRFRFYPTPHLPHGWDAGMMFEETQKTLFCSDLLHQFGDVSPLTTEDLIGPAVLAMSQMQQSPLASYMPYTADTKRMLSGLAQLRPQTLATMHGSAYSGDCEKIIDDFAVAMKDVFEPAKQPHVWTGFQQRSAFTPQSPCLPLRGSVRRSACPVPALAAWRSLRRGAPCSPSLFDALATATEAENPAELFL